MPVPEPAPVVPKPEPKKNTPWPTAEEEKLRLYQEAQNAAYRTQIQGLADEDRPGRSLVNGGSPPPKQAHPEEPSVTMHKQNSLSQDEPAYPTKLAQPTETKTTGAQLYQHAIASMSKKPSVSRPVNPPSPPAPKSQRSYPTAEEEKAALRYWEAKRAVDRHQQVSAMNMAPLSPDQGDGPIAYDDLYPAGVSAAQAGSSHMVNGHGRRVSESSSRDHVAPPPPPPMSSPPASIYESAMSEKERLRRKYEAEDAAASRVSPPTPPARASGSRASPPGYDSPLPPSSLRSQPLPPADYSGPRFLTAAEEKARLRAQMEAEEAAAAVAQGSSSAGPSRPTGPPTRSPSLMSYVRHEPSEDELPPPPPPPLAPRPPADYIERTLEEDLRSQAEQHAVTPAIASNGINGTSAPLISDESPSRVDFGLSFRPFSPLDLGVNFDSLNRRAPSAALPPPLPPKVPVSQ